MSARTGGQICQWQSFMRGGHGGKGRGMVLTHTHDCKALVDEDAVLPDEAARPVRPSMTQAFRQGDGTRSGTCGILEPMDAEYSAHFTSVGYATAMWGGDKSDVWLAATVQPKYGMGSAELLPASLVVSASNFEFAFDSILLASSLLVLTHCQARYANDMHPWSDPMRRRQAQSTATLPQFLERT